MIDLEEGGEEVRNDHDQVFDDKTKISHSFKIPKIVHNQSNNASPNQKLRVNSSITKPRSSLKNSTSVPEVITTQSTEETLIDDFEEMDLSRFDEFKDSIFGRSLSPPKPVHSVHQKSRSTPVNVQRVLETSFDGIEVDEEFYRRNQKRYDSVLVTNFE